MALMRFASPIDRRIKTVVLALIDATIASISAILVLNLFNGLPMSPSVVGGVFIAAACISVASGAARMMVHTFDVCDFTRISTAGLAVTTVFLSLAAFGVPVTLPDAVILFPLLLCGFIWVRLFVSFAMKWLRSNKDRSKVVIYGAGVSGQQLAGVLRSSNEMLPVAFLDDNPTLQDAIIGGLKVYSPQDISRVVEWTSADKVFIAIPSLSSERRNAILDNLRSLKVDIRILPSYLDIIRKGGVLNAVNTVDPNNLLGRKVIDVDLPEMKACYSGSTVLISGAGGSIGSELCRQVIKASPKRLVLLEVSEFALYNIHMELSQHQLADKVEIIPVLGTCCDRANATKLSTLLLTSMFLWSKITRCRQPIITS